MKIKMNNIIKKIKGGIYLLFIFIMGFYLTLSLISSKLSLDTFGFSLYLVKSNSMKPIFQRGDLLIVTKTNTNDLRENDVIAVEKDDKMRIAHFLADQEISKDNKLIFKTRQFSVKTKLSWDYESFTREQILGRVNFIIPKIGHLSLFLQKTSGKISIVALIFIIYLLKSYYEDNQKVN